MSHFSHLTKGLCCWLREWPTASAQCWVAWSSARVVTSSTCRQTPAVEVLQVWLSTRARSSSSKVCHRECVTSWRPWGFVSRAFNLVTSRRNWSGTQLTWRQVFISVFFFTIFSWFMMYNQFFRRKRLTTEVQATAFLTLMTWHAQSLMLYRNHLMSELTKFWSNRAQLQSNLLLSFSYQQRNCLCTFIKITVNQCLHVLHDIVYIIVRLNVL